MKNIPLCVRTGSFALLLVALAGCAAGPKSFDAAKNEHVRVVAVTSVAPHPGPTIRNFGSPSALLGGAVAVSIAASNSARQHRDQLTQLLENEGFDFSRELEAALSEHLSGAGYRVLVAEVTRDNPHQPLRDYSAVANVEADAVLDVSSGLYYGFSNVSILDSKFRPHMDINVRLVEPRNGKVLYDHRVIYGYRNPFMGGTQIQAPQEHHFDSMDEVYTDPPLTVAGMRAGVAAIASTVAEQLKRQ